MYAPAIRDAKAEIPAKYPKARSGRNLMLGGNPRQITQEILARADVRLDGARPWDISVHRDDFYARILRQGSLGLGESYMDGWWDCEALDELIRRLLSSGIDRDRSRTWHFAWRYLLAGAFNRQTRTRSWRVAELHYDRGNDLYRNMLDRRMVYTCARWDGASNLDDAQEAKLRCVCEKLDLRPGMRLLDIGCGWGGLAQFAAQKYGVHVTGITLSREQLQFGRVMCADLPVELRLQDYRDLRETFDRVVSLGMFEHVGYKNYRTYFEVVRASLPPGGLFYLSSIGTSVSVRLTDPWIEKYIFPNSHLPSPQQIAGAIPGLFAIEDWENWGADYDRTLTAWFGNFDRNWDRLKSRYDQRFYRMWKYYLLASAASFRARNIWAWQILFSRE